MDNYKNVIRKYLSGIIKLFIAVVSSLCLINIMELSTSFTDGKLKYLFVFFCIVSLGIIYLYNRYLGFYVNNRRLFIRSILLALALAISTIIIGKDIFINTNKKIELMIQPTGEKNVKSNGSEAWIASIVVNGESVDLSKFQLDNGWVLGDGNCIVSRTNQPSILKLSFNDSDKIEVELIKHPWSGIVQIINGDGEKITADLYSEKSDVYKYIPKHSDLKLNKETIFNSIFSMLFLIGPFYLIISLTNKYSFLRGIYVLILYLLAFLLNKKLSFDTEFKELMLVVSIISGVLVSKMSMKNESEKLYNRNNILCIMILSIYSAFALVGSHLFFQIKYVDISFGNIFILIIMTFWFFPIILSVFYLLYKLRDLFKKRHSVISNKEITRLSFEIFGIILLFGTIYIIGFYPANMTVDSITQWGQAVGKYQLNDWHPVLYTLMMRLLINIYESPVTIAILQLIFFDLVITSSIIFFYKRGLKKFYCIMIAIFIMLKLDNMVNIFTIWKDIPYSVCILWLTSIITKLVDDEEYLNSKYNNIRFLVCLILTSLLRHNGLFVTVCTLIFIFLSLNNKNKRKSILCYIVSFIVIFIIKGPIYNSLNVIENSPAVKYAAMMNDIEGVVFSGGELGNKTQDFLDSITTTENHKKMYNPFSFNNYLYGEGQKYNVLSKMENKSTSEFIAMYLDTFFRKPALVIQNRLNGMDLLWNIYPRTDSYDYRYSMGIIDNEFNLKSNENSLTKNLGNYLETSGKKINLDILTWRSGIYVIGLLIVTAFMWLTNKKKYLLISVPTYANILSLVLSMTWQDYRYVWFIPLTVWFLFLTIVTDNDNSKVIDLDKGK